MLACVFVLVCVCMCVSVCAVHAHYISNKCGVHYRMNQAVPGSDSSTNTKQTSQSHWEVIIEDLSSDDDELE